MSIRISALSGLLIALYRRLLMLPLKLMLPLGIVACDPQPTVTPQQQPSQVAQTLRIAEYRVAPGDRLRVVVLSDPELSGEYEIDSAGVISPRMAGRVPVMGMTTAEIEEMLRARYRTDGLLRVARLSVDLVGRRPFYVLGEVGRPGFFPYVSGINVDQAGLLGLGDHLGNNLGDDWT